ncbi:inositol-1-monophosphatase [Zea mays]|uniref:histidinol-phosphatase n=2 Tax=Zea mays TaxID=4577 RepID=B6SMK8_MAIZE|nr:inositol-1-monophosphatase [Zea mays]ACG26091.1 inositol-1-monophosphatase [Zea mays]ACN31376.1 unknown [Zea mays]AQK89503.1 Inositol-1-monophosphatase [Zea mays]|eukprot:NP_001147208.1 inositol-1-monophosphatase [Zea mays]
MLSSSSSTHSATSPFPGLASANPNPRSRLLRLRAASPVSSAVLSASGRQPMSTVRASFAAGAAGRRAAAVGELATERLVEVAQRAADAAGEVLRKYFRQRVEIIDKEDHSPVTIADREAEEAMVSVILKSFPTHAIFGEENGWRCAENSADFVWVLDPIDGTKSFITGKPLFGTLIALLHNGKPVIGVIDQPILRERWIGVDGKQTTLNGQEISVRSCNLLAQAYLYTTSPHLFEADAEDAFIRVRNKVKVPLYGCDCYAYALLASGFVDIVVESGLKPYDFLSLVPVIEGAGGSITDWRGDKLHWPVTAESRPTSFNVVAAGDARVHKEALDALRWR